MDGFVALMTEDFHESEWTDQEIGYAFARGVPIIAARLGGKFQALRCTWASAPSEIARLLIKNDRMFAAYLIALRKCPDVYRGNELAAILPEIEKLSDEQLDALVGAFNGNIQLQASYAFNGSRPKLYGPGLPSYLKKLSNRAFEIRQGRIEWSQQ